MVAVAAGLSIFAAWYRYQAGDAALRFWGKETALQIRSAPRVELLAIEPGAAPENESGEAQRATIGGDSYQITRTIDITEARGLIHARHALLEDASLDPAAPPPDAPPAWTRLLRFTDREGGAALIAIDPETGWLCRVETGGMIKLKEPQRSLAAYVRRLMPMDASPPMADRAAP